MNIFDARSLIFDYLRLAAIRSSIERPSVFLRRQVNEAFINQYNKKSCMPGGPTWTFNTFLIHTLAQSIAWLYTEVWRRDVEINESGDIKLQKRKSLDTRKNKVIFKNICQRIWSISLRRSSVSPRHTKHTM